MPGATREGSPGPRGQWAGNSQRAARPGGRGVARWHGVDWRSWPGAPVVGVWHPPGPGAASYSPPPRPWASVSPIKDPRPGLSAAGSGAGRAVLGGRAGRARCRLFDSWTRAPGHCGVGSGRPRGHDQSRQVEGGLGTGPAALALGRPQGEALHPVDTRPSQGAGAEPMGPRRAGQACWLCPGQRGGGRPPPRASRTWQ